jgi:hypothetical protein
MWERTEGKPWPLWEDPQVSGDCSPKAATTGGDKLETKTGWPGARVLARHRGGSAILEPWWHSCPLFWQSIQPATTGAEPLRVWKQHWPSEAWGGPESMFRCYSALSVGQKRSKTLQKETKRTKKAKEGKKMEAKGFGVSVFRWFGVWWTWLNASEGRIMKGRIIRARKLFREANQEHEGRRLKY